MLSMTIALLLIQQTVERNPGPQCKKLIPIKIVTFNTNGLGDKKKLRRLVRKVDPIVSKGGIVMLQETHLKEVDYLTSIWKNNLATNCTSTNSAGVLTLYSNEYKLEEEFSDKKGRQLIIVISTEEEKLIVANAYYPNDHKESLIFNSEICEEILRLQQKHPDAETIYAGDFNMCVTSETDSLNRGRTKQEDEATALLSQNNIVMEITDSYRSKQPKEGYTWSRGECLSRLDYTFMTRNLINRVTAVRTDWAFEKSDHAAVIISVNPKESTVKGPGLVKINTKILNDPQVVKKIEEEIKSMMEQVNEDWNPHLKLEFLKVCIRTIFASRVMEIRKEKNVEITEAEDELNQINSLKIKILEEYKQANIKSDADPQEKLRKIETAIMNMSSVLCKLRNELSNKLKFISTAKWFEYGEKSNKFFMNLNKRKQNQKLIYKIKKNDVDYHGQEEISGCIRDFYQDLYKAHKCEQNEENFYKNCPKLSQEKKNFMDEKLKLKDLSDALKTCKDSAPGPDGIPYVVYKNFWKITGQIILDAWNYSMETGTLAPSHVESIITLLPKEGKNKEDIKNWRPITLSNCDSKIITKAMSNKMAKVLNSIIDQSQTAYIKGRSVSDNLRANFFVKDGSKKNNISSLLISLDAKKAFDSVDHEYIKETLKQYGFGEYFIRSFETLYKNITARILVNGFTTESIKIQRGVKQGDALSCAIFIICIDPLLRNLNNNRNIEGITICKKLGLQHKAAAFADDISVMCKNNQKSVQNVFKEYEKLTKISGLELNADKTEILILNESETKQFCFEYNNIQFKINSVKRIKICGLYYATDNEDEYNLNVREKIQKLSNKIRAWSHRHLTMEGKVLIVKTFGLSQLIYNMQSYRFNQEEIIQTERIIFKFLWSNGEAQTGVDRIKRSIMKNDYSKGGMSTA